MRFMLIAISVISFFLLGSCDTKAKTVGSCGDGFLDPGEPCDGSQLTATACSEFGYYVQTGELRCNSDCTFELSMCTGGRCGDRTIQTVHGESCDGDKLDGQTCVTLGFSQGSGALGCTEACVFDDTECVPKRTNADLTTLEVGRAPLIPVFSAGTTSYTMTVPMLVTELSVTAAAADTYASVSIAPTQPMTLSLGDNPVTVTVTAESGEQKVYSVLVTQTATPDFESPNLGTLKYVPGGTFQRDPTPTNLSTVSAFWMSRYEITRAQWASVTGWSDPSDIGASSGTGDPVQMMSWYDAIAFCNKLSLLEGLTPVYVVSGVDFSTLTYSQIPATDDATWNAATVNWAAEGYRLPTEMEWMWAAMGADTTNPGATNTTGFARAFAGSTGSNVIDDYAWYMTNSSGKTHPAGTKIPNELGLFDLSGNVYERVWDWHGTYPTGPVTDYPGPASGTHGEVRGGSWRLNASYCEVAIRIMDPQHSRSNDVGFRVVRR
ncbi:SUMF1/EgtB/PvdO family nonheme iron enzyme [Myxococcota bacterium]|nr:SUMF1/EgtB/PvdO family nonheme iron enzyme [Myxococcota bacterium]